MNIVKMKFNSHLNHNPDCDILEGHLNDGNAFITYGIYVKGTKTGSEFMEYYSGQNYGGKSKKSYSRLYNVNEIPKTYKAIWDKLKQEYIEKYRG